MSKYIHIPDKVSEWQEQHRQVISGTLSKIAMFNSSLFLLQNSNPKYFRQKISLRFKKEEQNAHINHGQSLCQNYLKLKQGLKVYARSKSYKVEKAFQTEGRPEKSQVKHKQIRNTHAIARNDKTIFIDRKYNKEFAIQTAVASEINSINEQKLRVRKAMSQQYISPLAKQSKILCMNALLTNIQKHNEKNPLIIHQLKSNGLKRRRKDFEKVYIFNKGRGAD